MEVDWCLKCWFNVGLPPAGNGGGASVSRSCLTTSLVSLTSFMHLRTDRDTVLNRQGTTRVKVDEVDLTHRGVPFMAPAYGCDPHPAGSEGVSMPGVIRMQDELRKREKKIVESKHLDASVEAPLRRRATVGFIVAALLTILVGVSYWRVTRAAENDAYGVAHTYAVMDGIECASSNLTETQPTARAFAFRSVPLSMSAEQADGFVNRADAMVLLNIQTKRLC